MSPKMDFKLWMEVESWNKFARQREFPFMQQKGNPYQRQFEDPYAPSGYEKGNLYHVTSALSAIKSDGQLKSRAQLDGKSSGLGGGYKNEAPNLVSLTYSFDRAKEIYEEYQYVAAVLAGKVKAFDIYRRMNNHMDFNHDYDDEGEESLNGVEKYLAQNVAGISQPIINGDEKSIEIILNRMFKTPQACYSLFQHLEQAVMEGSDRENPDELYAHSVIGFTSSFESMQYLRQSEIAIIQCVMRKKSTTDTVPQEVEVRADPKNVAIVRYLQPPVNLK